jgi:NAD(P)-dependent dehydrogenase (short-subunit alcohol dehydrogenase family)
VQSTNDARPAQTLTFDGDVVIVTGAGAGLGRAHAMELARRGARVVVNDLGVDPDGRGTSAAAADATVAAIRAAGGIAEPNSDSVADPDGARAIVATALDTWGRLDAVVHNAGFSRDNYVDQLSDDEIGDVMDVHLLGAFYLARPAYATMKENGGGRMVFTTSTAGLLGAPLMANYGAAKMGVVGLTRSIALEGQQYGITSNALSPGALTRRGDDKNAFRFTARANPLDTSALPGADRFTPERVAPMVALLCHSSCPVTGEVLMARAGWFARAWIAASPGWIAEPGEIRAEDLLEHWDEISGAGRCEDELPLDGPGWSIQFLNERIKPLLGTPAGA